MTKDEAKEQMELLKLAGERLNEEKEVVLDEFCRRGNHYFRKVWELVAVEKDEKIFRAVGYFCVLCESKLPLQGGENHCPICDELREIRANGGGESETPCSFCGFVNYWTPPVGVPRGKIPAGEIIYRRRFKNPTQSGFCFSYEPAFSICLPWSIFFCFFLPRKDLCPEPFVFLCTFSWLCASLQAFSSPSAAY